MISAAMTSCLIETYLAAQPIRLARARLESLSRRRRTSTPQKSDSR